jgi:hypothetical protein
MMNSSASKCHTISSQHSPNSRCTQSSSIWSRFPGVPHRFAICAIREIENVMSEITEVSGMKQLLSTACWRAKSFLQGGNFGCGDSGVRVGEEGTQSARLSEGNRVLGGVRSPPRIGGGGCILCEGGMGVGGAGWLGGSYQLPLVGFGRVACGILKCTEMLLPIGGAWMQLARFTYQSEWKKR